MLTWLANDLATTTQDWIIAYWHHPPYSKGTHDSDTEGRLIDMRQNLMPPAASTGKSALTPPVAKPVDLLTEFSDLRDKE